MNWLLFRAVMYVLRIRIWPFLCSNVVKSLSKFTSILLFTLKVNQQQLNPTYTLYIFDVSLFIKLMKCHLNVWSVIYNLVYPPTVQKDKTNFEEKAIVWKSKKILFCFFTFFIFSLLVCNFIRQKQFSVLFNLPNGMYTCST